MILEAREIKVIQVTETRGSGTEENPCRVVRAIYSLEGEKICEIDTTLSEKCGGECVPAEQAVPPAFERRFDYWRGVRELGRAEPLFPNNDALQRQFELEKQQWMEEQAHSGKEQNP